MVAAAHTHNKKLHTRRERGGDFTPSTSGRGSNISHPQLAQLERLLCWKGEFSTDAPHPEWFILGRGSATAQSCHVYGCCRVFSQDEEENGCTIRVIYIGVTKYDSTLFIPNHTLELIMVAKIWYLRGINDLLGRWLLNIPRRNDEILLNTAPKRHKSKTPILCGN